MDHSEATGVHAVEKYLLGELESSEKELFEEHFFTCALCAAEVKAGAMFADNLRSVARDEARPSFASPRVQPATQTDSWGSRFRNLLSWPVLVPSLAAAAFGAIAIVQTLFTIPGLKSELAQYEAPQEAPAFALHAAVRSAGKVETFRPHTRFFTLYFDITRKWQAASYVCVIVDSKNRQRFELETKRENRETINLLLDSSHFESGTYTLIVRSTSNPSEELLRNEFNLEIDK